MSFKSFAEAIARPLEEKTEEKRGRKPGISVEYNIDMVDDQILKLARAVFSGMNFARLVMGFGHDISKSDTTNRQIVGESLERLTSRGLVKVSGTGSDRYIRAVNRKDFRKGDLIFVRDRPDRNGIFECFSDDEDHVWVVFGQHETLISIGLIESIVYRDGVLVRV